MSLLRAVSVSLLSFVLLLTAMSGFGFAQHPNPTPQKTEEWRNKPCRDPWISYGYVIATAGISLAQGVGDQGECNCNLYNYCRWNSFDELVNHIRGFRDTMWRKGAGFKLVPDARGTKIEHIYGGKTIGYMVAAGGGNIIAAGGGNIVAAGGGNIQTGLPPANFRGQKGVIDVIDLASGVAVVIKEEDVAKKDEKK